MAVGTGRRRVIGNKSDVTRTMVSQKYRATDKTGKRQANGKEKGENRWEEANLSGQVEAKSTRSTP